MERRAGRRRSCGVLVGPWWILGACTTLSAEVGEPSPTLEPAAARSDRPRADGPQALEPGRYRATLRERSESSCSQSWSSSATDAELALQLGADGSLALAAAIEATQFGGSWDRASQGSDLDTQRFEARCVWRALAPSREDEQQVWSLTLAEHTGNAPWFCAGPTYHERGAAPVALELACEPSVEVIQRSKAPARAASYAGDPADPRTGGDLLAVVRCELRGPPPKIFAGLTRAVVEGLDGGPLMFVAERDAITLRAEVEAAFDLAIWVWEPATPSGRANEDHSIPP